MRRPPAWALAVAACACHSPQQAGDRTIQNAAADPPRPASTCLTMDDIPAQISAAGGDVFWVDSHRTSLGRVGFSSRPTGTVLAGRGELGAIAAADSEVFVVEEAGDEIRILGLASERRPRVVAAHLRPARDLVIDGDQLFWLEADDDGDDVVRTVPTRGGEVATLGDAPHASTGSLAVGDTSVFWVGDDGLFRMPRRGGPAQRLWLGRDEAGGPAGEGESYGGSLLALGDGAVFVVSSASQLVRVPLEGGEPQEVDQDVAALAANPDGVAWLVWDPTEDRGERWHMRWHLRWRGNGDRRTIELASGDYHPEDLAADATAVYLFDPAHATMCRYPVP